MWLLLIIIILLAIVDDRTEEKGREGPEARRENGDETSMKEL
jgi:hypothetical protein